MDTYSLALRLSVWRPQNLLQERLRRSSSTTTPPHLSSSKNVH